MDAGPLRSPWGCHEACEALRGAVLPCAAVKPREALRGAVMPCAAMKPREALRGAVMSCAAVKPVPLKACS